MNGTGRNHPNLDSAGPRVQHQKIENDPTTSLHTPNIEYSQIISHSLCYVNYRNAILMRQILANLEHQNLRWELTGVNWLRSAKRDLSPFWNDNSTVWRHCDAESS
jgi:hypothetical protein